MSTKSDIIFLAGLPASGKTTIRSELERRGIPSYYTGDFHPNITGEEAERYGDEHFDSDSGFICQVVEAAVDEYTDESLIVIEALRKPAEVSYVRSRAETAHVVAVVCDRAEREKRLKQRKKSIEFHKRRDQRELGNTSDSSFDIGHVIATSDYFIDNSHSFEYLYDQIEYILDDIRQV